MTQVARKFYPLQKIVVATQQTSSETKTEQELENSKTLQTIKTFPTEIVSRKKVSSLADIKELLEQLKPTNGESK